MAKLLATHQPPIPVAAVDATISKAIAKRYGHEVKCFKVDPAPELRSADFKEKCERELEVTVDVGPRHRHEHVGGAEARRRAATQRWEAPTRCAPALQAQGSWPGVG